MMRLTKREREARYAAGWPRKIMPAAAGDVGLDQPVWIIHEWCESRGLHSDAPSALVDYVDMHHRDTFWGAFTRPAARARILNRALYEIGYRVNNPEGP